MRTSFHHQPEAQHPNFQLPTSWQADYPIFLGYSGREMLAVRLSHFGPNSAIGGQFCCDAQRGIPAPMW
jgi:hypothetical protein